MHRILKRLLYGMCGDGLGKLKLPVLTVLPVVVVSTFTAVTVRPADAARCVFTWVHQARIHAVASKVTCHTTPKQMLNTFHT